MSYDGYADRNISNPLTVDIKMFYLCPVCTEYILVDTEF